ncbi:M20/M25/M40 family metallo-hydrolase [Pseudodesulfovibrio sp. JC047]|uniref:M20 family metallopeptidase n=1 Tax=Pseudodesulfovibrio sp. JC047 TaxID=2683199 RepID=UPI0013D304E5|nr:M20 family metallopeptidase [Pseudodesulfovibrio sp. JC047]NDV18513.1 M20/M25/M40 family metallo-hydrolase [Pseudodesulfovibrio sp. JC047]
MEIVQSLKNYLEKNEQEMFALLEKIVNINSYSGNKDGVNEVVDILESTFKDMGFSTRRQPRETTGDNLAATSPAHPDGGGLLMIGHMDTVFPPEMGFNSYKKVNNTIYGPGVYDMQGGLVVGIFAAKALQAIGALDRLPVGFAYNSDEEIGSPHSRDFIVEEAQKRDFCFVMEGSGANGGEIVTGRKGRIVFELTVTGKAGHAGNAPSNKASAIATIAQMVTALEALNNPEAGTSLNVGVIEGGVGPNTIAATATARVETRFTSPEGRDAVWTAIQSIVNAPKVPGTSATLDIEVERPPMVPNEANLQLFESVDRAAKELGLTVKSCFRGGGSDANVISEAGVPVVDGLGTSGDKLHTPDETMRADSMVRQAILTALSAIRAYEKYA